MFLFVDGAIAQMWRGRADSLFVLLPLENMDDGYLNAGAVSGAAAALAYRTTAVAPLKITVSSHFWLSKRIGAMQMLFFWIIDVMEALVPFITIGADG